MWTDLLEEDPLLVLGVVREDDGRELLGVGEEGLGADVEGLNIVACGQCQITQSVEATAFEWECSRRSTRLSINDSITNPRQPSTHAKQTSIGLDVLEQVPLLGVG